MPATLPFGWRGGRARPWCWARRRLPSKVCTTRRKTLVGVRFRFPSGRTGKPLPQVQVVDMAREFSGGSRSMFSKQLSDALETELAAGHKAVLLLNQRGFAKFVLCRDCGFVPACPSCSTSLTFHERGNALICHHCGYRVASPPTCPSCGSPYLKKFGAGTQRVEADLRALIATASPTWRARCPSFAWMPTRQVGRRAPEAARPVRTARMPPCCWARR